MYLNLLIGLSLMNLKHGSDEGPRKSNKEKSPKKAHERKEKSLEEKGVSARESSRLARARAR